MHEYTASDSLRKHMYAVEAAMRAYADHFSEDAGALGPHGLMHDFDYERWPNAEHSPTEAPRCRRARASRARYPEMSSKRSWGTRAIRACARVTDVENAVRGRRADRADHGNGARAAVEDVHEVDARSVRKKMKDKGFARGVNRDDVVNGAADLGVDLDWHIQFVTDAMKARAESLGLAGT
jgi:predicted hydrolase (HD superfamily)